MTNDTKPSAEEVARWESIKQDMLDRADIIANFDDEEREAVKELRWLSMSLAEDVHYLTHFSFRNVVNFCANAKKLDDEYGWSASECKDKREIGRLSMKLCELLGDEASDNMIMTLEEAKEFHTVYFNLRQLENTKPNKYQMERFAEHGITWEGEVDEH